MINEKIKQLRIANGLTQKELADKLFVTAQAVSRWENGEVEPSVSTIQQMSKIFDVSIDEMFGNKPRIPEPQIIKEKEYVVSQSKPVLAVCEQCNKPIYKGSQIVRKTSGESTKVICKSCDDKNKKIAFEEAVDRGLKRRKRSFVWGGIFTGLIMLVVFLVLAFVLEQSTAIVAISTAGSLLFFPFLSCLFLDNNFVGDMVGEICSWGFVTLPGIIFDLSLDGIIWLLTVKLVFWILGFILASACTILAVAVGLIVSLFVYPYAIRKNFNHPELCN